MRACLAALALTATVESQHHHWHRDPFDCGFPNGNADVAVQGNCQVRPGPDEAEDLSTGAWQRANDDWRATYEAWRTSTRTAFDFSAYDTPEIQWAQTSYVQPQAMLHDRYLYDRATRQWTVGKYLVSTQRKPHRNLISRGTSL